MRVPIRNTVDLALAAAIVLLRVAFDAFLVGIFLSNLRRALIAPGYRPIFLRSGRRNRARI
jgi:hypothetical protein